MIETAAFGFPKAAVPFGGVEVRAYFKRLNLRNVGDIYKFEDFQ